jgi:LPPG:FO 2-phospho-L-lactate transferase
VVAVSPIVAGKALKGPAAKIMAELGLECSSRQIARHYAGLIDAIIIDHADGALGQMQVEREADAGAEKGVDRGVDGGVTVLMTKTVMTTREDKVALARDCLALCGRLAKAAPAAPVRQRSSET